MEILDYNTIYFNTIRPTILKIFQTKHNANTTVLFASGCVCGTALQEPALRITQQEPISDNEPCTVGMSTDSSVPNFKRLAGFI